MLILCSIVLYAAAPWLGSGLTHASGALPVIEAEDAGEHIGEEVVVEGEVRQVVCSPQTCLLSFEAGFAGLVVRILPGYVDRFPSPREAYEEQLVRVRGSVTSSDGRPRIEATDPMQVEVVSRQAAEPAPPSSGSRILSMQDSDAAATAGGASGSERQHLSEVVRELQSEARASETVASGQGGTALVRGLRERVTEQERTIEELGELIQGLEGRLEGLETAEPQAPVYRGPAVPRLERYVVPARRGLEAKVRTGWSAERLVRELGEPAQVTGLSSGGAIWTYADGRSVTVDEKGRVVSSMGF